MSGFLNTVFVGLSNGSVYAMLAVGLVVIYRASGLLNFAQGEMAMFTTYFVWMFYDAGLPLPLAALLAMAAGFALGAITYQLLVRPVGNVAKDLPLATVIVTIGMFLAFGALASLLWGADNLELPKFIEGGTSLFDPPLAWQKLLALALLAIESLALYLLFTRTKLGLAMRAVASNAESAALCGINVSKVLLLTWGIAASIGVVAGVVWTQNVALSVTPALMGHVLIFAFAAITLGGFDSIVGAVVGGLLIGLVTELAPKYVGAFSGIPLGAALVVVLIVLMVRPQGLFGSKKVSRV